MCVQSAGLGGVCRDDSAISWYSIPSVASQQVQVREHEAGKEIIVAYELRDISMCSVLIERVLTFTHLGLLSVHILFKVLIF